MKKKLENLLKRLDAAYKESDNKVHYTNEKKWGYHLIHSYLKEDEPLVIGFNSGVDNSWEKYINGDEYVHQTNIIQEDFTSIYKGSLERALNMSKKYFPDISFNKGSHSNFCFFRSENENQITNKDIDLCKPIFEEMIEIVKPSIIFCFSDKARQHFIELKLLSNYQEERFFEKGSKSCLSAKAELKDGTKIFFLPHPNRPIKQALRIKAWEYCAA